jgi:ABC-type transporter MlaC component
MSDRFKKFTIQYDERTFLVGRVHRLPNKKLDYERFAVITYMGGVEYDVTKAMTEEQLAHFRQAFELELENKYMDALSAAPFGDEPVVHDWDEPGGAA